MNEKFETNIQPENNEIITKAAVTEAIGATAMNRAELVVPERIIVSGDVPGVSHVGAREGELDVPQRPDTISPSSRYSSSDVIIRR